LAVPAEQQARKDKFDEALAKGVCVHCKTEDCLTIQRDESKK
jgi:hypothetical protein